MAEPSEVALPASGPGLFKINLLGERVARMRRRMFFMQACSVAAVAMLIGGGILAAIAANNVASLVRLRQGQQLLARDLADAQTVSLALDKQRLEAAQKLGPFAPLVSVAQRRIVWAPKLVALAESLPPAAGILSIDAESGDLFWQPPKPAAAAQNNEKGGSSPAPAAPVPMKARAAGQMKFSVLCQPAVGGADPLPMLERLQGSPDFMKHMSAVRLDSAVQDDWQGIPAVVLSGTCQGAAEATR